MKLNSLGVFLLLSILPIFSFLLFEGCKKDNTPLGVNAPQGLDFPTATPVPFPGSINVAVLDYGVTTNGPALKNITVTASDPLGEPYSNTTDATGHAVFSFPNIKTGVWTLTIPPQGIYTLSQEYVTVGSVADQTVTFSWSPVSIVLSPLTNENFSPSVQTNILYTATYPETGGLNVPVSLYLTGIPNYWSYTFNPTTIGASAVSNISALDISVPACPHDDNVNFQAVYARPDAYTLPSTVHTISSSPSMAMTATWQTGAQCTSNCCTYTDYTYDLQTNLSANFACGPMTVSYSFSYSGTSGVPSPSSDAFIISAGGSHQTVCTSMGWAPLGKTPNTNLIVNYQFSGAVGSVSGSFQFNPGWGSCAYNTTSGTVFTKNF
jgi:hypothetical protein